MYFSTSYRLTIFLLSFSISVASCALQKSEFGKTIHSAPAGNGLTVRLNSSDGVLRDGVNDLTLLFEDEDGKGVDVGAASLNFRMPAMGTMPEMNDGAVLTTTRNVGAYRAEVKLQMAGEWIAQIAYEGSAGKGKVTVPVTAK